MVTVALGVTMFTFTIVSLVGLLMVARRQLVSTGEVTITVNDDPEKALHTNAGGTLLGTLAENKIFIPSACGGKGSCGVCTLKVLEGGGAVLPTELSHLNRGEVRCGVRLSCQVKVKQDMRIEIPADVFAIRQWRCQVRSNHNVATFIKELVLELPAGDAVPFRAGGYIQIEAPAGHYVYRDISLPADWLTKNRAVRRGDLLELQLRSGLILLRVPGRAEEAAAVGEVISCRNLESGSRVMARVLDSKHAEVEWVQ